jgi:tetratricopeptide (TPR) repeat protein
MTDEDNKEAAINYKSAKKAHKDGDSSLAFEYLEKCFKLYNQKTETPDDYKTLQNAYRLKGLIYKEQGKLDEARKCLKKAKQLSEEAEERFEEANPESLLDAASKMSNLMAPVAQLGLFVREGRADEAIMLANSIDMSTLGSGFIDTLAWLSLSKAYMLRPYAETAKAKRALLGVKSVFEKEGKQQSGILIDTYISLGKIAGIEGNKEKAVSYCEKAWKAIKDNGFENCDHNDLYNITNTGVQNSPQYDTLWFNRALEASSKLLESGRDDYGAAKVFVMTCSALYMTVANVDHPLIDERALECLKILEGAANAVLEAATAYWLATCVLVRDPSWPSDNSHTKRVLRMLRHTIRLAKSDGYFGKPFNGYQEQKEIASYECLVACSNGFLGDYHLAHGELELAASEYREGLRIMKRHFTKEDFFERFQAGLDKALGKS